MSDQEQLINSMREGYAHCKMLYEGKQPSDFVYLKVNTAFEQITGLKDVEGRKVSEVIPDIRKSNPELFEIYGKVASTGNPEMFETFLEPLGSWFSVSVYSTEKEHFIAVFQNISERKQTEQAIRESEIKYRQLFEASSDGIFLQDANGCFIDCNENGARMFGLSKDELIGRSPADFSPERQPDGRLSAEVAGEKLVAALSGKPQQFEFKTLRADGVIFDAVVLLSRVEIRGSFYIHVVARDITEHKRVEEVLKLNKVIIETAREGFWRVSLTGHLLEVNQAYTNIMGYTREELLGMHISQLSLKSVSPDMVSAMIRKITELGHISFETRHRRKDGGVVDFETSISYMENEKSLFAFLHDITERKKAEEALRVAAIAFETHDAIVITDGKANIVRVNQAFTDITGYSPEEVLGKNPRIMSSGRQDKTFYIEMWQQLLHTGSWATVNLFSP